MLHVSARIRNANARRGSALMLATLVVFVLASLSLGFLSMTMGQSKEQSGSQRSISAFYLAEAALNDGYVDLVTGGSGWLGSEANPVSLGTQAYWVEAVDNADGTTSLVATGVDEELTAQAELIVETAALGFFQFGAFADEDLVLASNVFSDSYNSLQGDYSSQVEGGFANDNGDVGSNDDVVVASNVDVHGAGQYGPDDDDSISLGSGVTMTGGYGAAPDAVQFDPIVVPSFASSGSLQVNGGNTVTVGPGDVYYDALTVRANGKLVVVGPARLVVDDLLLRSNGEIEFVATGGAIDVYGTGDFELRSNSTFTSMSQDPKLVSVYLTGVHDDPTDTSPKIELNSNNEFYGTIYAPDASITVESNFEIYGAVMSRWLSLASNTEIHYDESLRFDTSGGAPSFDVLFWRPLTATQYSILQ